jgi:hypothetical protein
LFLICRANLFASDILETKKPEATRSVAGLSDVKHPLRRIADRQFSVSLRLTSVMTSISKGILVFSFDIGNILETIQRNKSRTGSPPHSSYNIESRLRYNPIFEIWSVSMTY